MSDFRGLIKHSSNYLLANVATKALSFISIPVYTRLLTVSDYGIVNVFFATVQIATILLTLNTEVAISRFYYDTKNLDEFKKFVGTSVVLSGGIFLIMSLLSVLLLPQLSGLTGLSEILCLFILPVSLYYIINSVFTQIYNPMMESQKIAVVSSVQVYLAFGLSVLFILLLNKDKYYGQVYGTVTAMVLLSGYLLHNIKPYVKLSFEWKYVRYILSYSIPNLPYALSGLIISVFGRIIIGNNNGFGDAGIYSFSANIGALMLIIIMVTHQAWNPYYFRYMNEGDTASIDKDYDLIWRLTLTAGLFLSFFGTDIGILLGRPQYYGGLYLVPIFSLGYVFYQWAYVYMRNCGYAKRMIWNAVVVIASGVCNVIFSVWLIKSSGDLGVAVAFTLSYLILLVLCYLVNRFQLKLYSPSLKRFIKPFLLFGIFWSLAFSIVLEFQAGVIEVLIKAVLFVACAFLLMRTYLLTLIKKIRIKNNL